jgi:hypothetical protein
MTDVIEQVVANETLTPVIERPPTYYELNKERIHERYVNNAEKLKAYQTEYNQANREKYISYQKSYYEDKKEELLRAKKQKIVCECGKQVTLGHISCHKKTKIHLKKMEILQAQRESS